MEYLINLAILFCIYGTLALSLNMVVGMAGLLSLAKPLFTASAHMPPRLV